MQTLFSSLPIVFLCSVRQDPWGYKKLKELTLPRDISVFVNRCVWKVKEYNKYDKVADEVYRNWGGREFPVGCLVREVIKKETRTTPGIKEGLLFREA